MKSDDIRWFELFSKRLTRRDLARVSLDVAACIALASLPAAARAPRLRLQSHPFPFGVASGDPTDNSVVLWSRLAATALAAAGTGRTPISVAWELAADDQFRRIVRSGSAVAPWELGRSVHVEVEGLDPGREYWYRFLAAGEASATGRTVTAPAAAAMQNQLRFAFASCQHYESGFFSAYRSLVSDNPEFIVFLGDYIYERSLDAGRVREHEGDEVYTLDQYRGRYALYKRDVDLQLAHAYCPWIVASDDHEVDNNYAGDVSEQRTGVSEFLLRRAAAYQAFYEFLPLRRASLPRGPAMQQYRRFAFGTLLQLNVLDTRQYRGDQPCNDGNKPRCAASMSQSLTMLGDAQESWLTSGLRASRARWNVLANQVMFSEVERGTAASPAYSMDQWPGYFHARRRLLEFLASARPSNPVVLTGDSHSNWVSNIKADFANPASPVVGVEFVGTSISSGGDGNDATGVGPLSRNPHLKHFSNRRGYVMNSVTPDRWEADFRVLPYVTRSGALAQTTAKFVVENQRPGVIAG
jgi:alkaline phosphatase D